MFDYLFIGYGASTCLTLRSFIRARKLVGKRIAIVDPNFDKGNDKTFCFWSSGHDPILSHNKDLIDKSWSRISVDDHETEELAPLSYHHIESARLYTTTRRMLEGFEVEYIEDQVQGIHRSEDGLNITTSNAELQAKKVFDSRPAAFTQDEKHPFLWQSFIGFRIRLGQPTFDTEVYHKMDFQIPQEGATQFVYVLPFEKNEALVEWTRFGVERINRASAREGLIKHIREKYGEVEIVREELGAIPMASGAPEVEAIEGVLDIGTRAGKVKPSTGYAFKRMYDHAERLAADLPEVKPQRRFAFYDHLLLWILAVKPQWGRSIFKKLFRSQKATFVLHFLDEETSLWNEIRMFLRLPLKPFLQALGVYLWQGIEPAIRAFKVPIVALLLWILFQWSGALALGVSAVILIVGFLVIGLPHGALDAYLDRGARSLPHFVGRYLALMAAMLFLWWLSPLLALVLFLSYSALHFGETDAVEWSVRHRSLAFPWGVSLLAILLISHWAETVRIFSEWGLSISASTAGWATPALIGLFALNTFLAIKENKRAWMASLATLAIGTQLPLLIAFGLYFVGQHSLNGWNHLKADRGWTHIGMYGRGLPYTLGALIVFAGLWWFDTGIFTDRIGWLFIGLSVVSFPHVMLMHQFYSEDPA